MIFNFNNGGGGGADPTELYNALKFSGLVTPDMSYEDMVQALSGYFTDFFKHAGHFLGYNYASGLTASLSGYYNKNKTIYASHSNAINLTNVNSVTITYTLKNKGGSSSSSNSITWYVGIGTNNNSFVVSEQTKVNAYQNTNYSKTKTFVIDTSQLSGEHYIVASMFHSNTSWASGDTSSVTIDSVELA